MAGTPIICTTWKTTVRNPGLIGLKRIEGTRIIYDPAKMTLLSEKKDRVFRVTTVQELHALKEKLKSKPFVFVMTANLRNVKHYVVVKVTTNYRGTYFVQVNPAHSMISSVLDAKFEQAYESIIKGETFVIELNFNNVVSKLHGDLVNKSSWAGPHAVNGIITITNKQQDVNFIDCGGIWNYLCCFCRCLVHPFYLCYLNDTCQKYGYNFKNTPIALRTCLNGNVMDILNSGQNTSNGNRTTQIQVPQGQSNAAHISPQQDNYSIQPIGQASIASSSHQEMQVQPMIHPQPVMQAQPFIQNQALIQIQSQAIPTGPQQPYIHPNPAELPPPYTA